MTLHSRAQSRKGERFSRERKRARLFLSRAMRACPHCTEKCVRQLAHICSEKSGRQLDRFCSSGRGCVRAATAGTVAPSHLLLTFGKLTAKFEMLCKKLKASSFKASVGRRRHGRWVQVRAALWARTVRGEGVERRMWRGRRTVLALCARRVCVARAVRRRAGAGAREKRRVNERAWRGERRCVRAVCGKGDVCAARAMCVRRGRCAACGR